MLSVRPNELRRDQDSNLSATRLVLIRHAHVAANGGGADAPMAGWTDLALSEEGRLQIERLQQHFAGSKRFDAIYSSTLRRARETAQPLADLGVGELRLCGALKEINCGEADGLPVGEVQRRFPELWRENLEQARDDFRWPGGESYGEFRQRCLAAIESIAIDHLGGSVAVVTHAGVISQLLGAIYGLRAGRWALFRPGNASVSELLHRQAGYAMLSFDCRAHLFDGA